MFWNKSENNNSEEAVKNAFASIEQNQEKKESTLTGASSKDKGFLEKGVIVGYENFINWQQNNSRPQLYEGIFSGIGKEEAIKTAVLAIVNDGTVFCKIGKKEAGIFKNKLKKIDPILEFQPILEVKLSLKNVKYSYVYETTKQRGDAEFGLNSGYHGYYTTYITDHTPNDNIAKYKDVEPKKEVEYTTEDPRYIKPTSLNDVRFRVEPNRYEHIVETAKQKILGGAEKFALNKAKEALAKEKKWTASKITCTIKGLGYENFRVQETYVPFWFFTEEINGTKCSARVNAVTKEVDFVVNNPNFQFGEKDDVAVSAVSKYYMHEDIYKKTLEMFKEKK